MAPIAAHRYDGRVVVVTGAAQGIGRACALRMAAEGARVVLVDRAAGPCEAVRDQITANGGDALLVAADLEQHEGAQAVVQAALQAHGRVDVSVHNVGGTIWAKPFWEYAPDEMQREINRSLWPTLWCCREMAALMKRQGQGAIVNVGSIATRGIYRVPYAAAKGGVHAMTVAMAMELAEFGVRVNCVSPGAIDNGQRVVPRNPQPLSEAETDWMKAIYTQSLRDTPMNRLGTPEEIAAAIGFLGAPEASYVTGQVLFVGGGASAEGHGPGDRVVTMAHTLFTTPRGRKPLTAAYVSLAEHAARLRRRETTAVALIDACAQNHARTEHRLNAYKTWDGARARTAAAAVDTLLDQGMDLGPLMGLPVSVKDLYGVPGLPVFAGSDEALPEAWQAAGPLVARLQQQLGIVVGKTHTVEFAFGGLGVNAHWGTPWNPWSRDEHRVPGGSSAGAGVSLAQGSALLALGTDTAGSVRVPASMTGQVGLKTTLGRWPVEGIVPLSSSLDTAGVLTRTVEDLAYAFAALDPEHAGQPAPAPARLQGLRVGVPTNHFWDDIDPSIGAVVEASIERLAQAGAQVVRFELPRCEEAFDIFRRGGLAASELAAYLDLNFPHKVERLDPVVRDRVRWAEQVSSVEYLRRKAVLQRCGAGAVRVFDDVDVLLTPTVPASPPRLADIGTVEAYAPANMKAMRNTAISNLFGWCALTMPVGMDANRMPVGLQLMGPPRAEARLIGIALGIEALIGQGHALLGSPDLS